MSCAATGGDDAVAAAAAGWIVRLSADDSAEREAARAGFEAWKAADPRHAAVAARLEAFVDGTRRLGAAAPAQRAARSALGGVLAPTPRRRHLAGAALGLFVAVGIGMLLRLQPATALLADLATGPGELRSSVLADGSRLTLAGGSAVDLGFDAGTRRVSLLQGEVLVEVAKDPARPFVVETAHGRVRALGTRFIVRRDADATLLTMIESSTAASTAPPAAGGETVVVAGQSARLDARGVTLLGAVDAGAAEQAFQHRRLVADDLPLAEVLDVLARHRRGLVRYDRDAIAGIRVSAVLPLDDTDRALQLLQNSFPQLRVRLLSRWLVLVDRPG
ncbi:FecR family protein [Rubrivivax benzoatilyticus]|uniref:FecR family protein n=1 Tax=Rubrivivax benzoatilyticus TaxID=316997 RepID=UPI0003FFC48D|nr:FecR domain-containing protein [Rubrivivax benzoatilyticus]